MGPSSLFLALVIAVAANISESHASARVGVTLKGTTAAADFIIPTGAGNIFAWHKEIRM